MRNVSVHAEVLKVRRESLFEISSYPRARSEALTDEDGIVDVGECDGADAVEVGVGRKVDSDGVFIRRDGGDSVAVEGRRVLAVDSEVGGPRLGVAGLQRGRDGEALRVRRDGDFALDG